MPVCVLSTAPCSMLLTRYDLTMEPTPATNLNRIRTAELLRTKGALTGNFGKARVKAGSSLNEIGVSQRESVGSFPTQEEYTRRLLTALELTSDPQVRQFIASELQKHKLRKVQNDNRILNPAGPHCDLRSRDRFAGH